MLKHLTLASALVVAMGAPAALAGPFWTAVHACISAPGQAQCAFQYATGNDNSASIIQSVVGSDPSQQLGLTYQNGDGNIAYTHQDGQDQFSGTVQVGNNNQAYTYQNGANQHSKTIETGNNGWAASSSTGDNTHTSVVLSGS